MKRIRVFYTREQVEAFLKNRFPDVPWQETIKRLPPIVWRARWDSLAASLGLPYSRGHLQNLDWRGKGPSSYGAGK
jgi:hypothetical protein